LIVQLVLQLTVVDQQAPRPDLNLLILPSVRELSSTEKSFVAGKIEKDFLDGLEKLSVPGASVYISSKPGVQEMNERKKRIIGSLMSKMKEDGSVDGSKLSRADFNDICQMFYGLDSTLTKDFPSVGVRTRRTFQFNIDGKDYKVNEERGRAGSTSPIYSVDEMVKFPKNLPVIVIDPKNPPPPPVQTDFLGAQVLFAPNSLNRFERAKIISEAMKAFVERERKEFERVSTLMDEAFYKMKYDDENVSFNGFTAPKSALQTLAQDLMNAYPQKYKTVEDTKNAIESGKLIRTTYDVGIEMVQKENGIKVTGVAVVQSQTIRP
jgi:hypothetical protein